MITRKLGLANFVTLTRILGVGFLFLITPYSTNFWQLWCIFIYTLIAITDFLDGWIARNYDQVSEFGKVMDPLADKILVLVFLPLLSMQAIPSFPVFIILAREFAIMAIRVFSAKGGYIISASTAGKLKTAITLPTVGILMARVPVQSVHIPPAFLPLEWLKLWVFSWPDWVISILIWSMVITTVWSFFDYLIKFMYQRGLAKYEGDTDKAKKQLLAFIPNFVSLGNLMCGMGAIFISITGITTLGRAGALILIGIILDGFDGKLARKFGTHSKFGQSLDSKADFVTFGVAPAILIYTVLSELALPYITLIALVIAAIYYISVHYRLNRYNQGGHSDYFEGLPSPTGAAGIVFATFAPLLAQPVPLILIYLALSALMASTAPYPHNRIAHQKMGYRFLPPPSLALWAIAITGLIFKFNVLQDLRLFELLFAISCIYFAAPIIPLRKEFRAPQ